jgi:hypothetical protein
LIFASDSGGRGSARVTPLAVVRVSPQFLEDTVDDMIRAALDEPSIVFEELIDWLFEFYFSSHEARRSLNDWHSLSPFPNFCHRGKKAGTRTRAAGRERPHETFGRLGRKKVGSLPPDFAFLPR